MTAWQCGLNPFRSLEVVPTSCREKLAKAVSIVIRRIQEAQSEEELNRGLKWFLLLPQLFLRESQSSNAVSARLDCVSKQGLGLTANSP